MCGRHRTKIRAHVHRDLSLAKRLKKSVRRLEKCKVKIRSIDRRAKYTWFYQGSHKSRPVTVKGCLDLINTVSAGNRRNDVIWRGMIDIDAVRVNGNSIMRRVGNTRFIGASPPIVLPPSSQSRVLSTYRQPTKNVSAGTEQQLDNGSSYPIRGSPDLFVTRNVRG